MKAAFNVTWLCRRMEKGVKFMRIIVKSNKFYLYTVSIQLKYTINSRHHHQPSAVKPNIPPTSQPRNQNTKNRCKAGHSPTFSSTMPAKPTICNQPKAGTYMEHPLREGTKNRIWKIWYRYSTNKYCNYSISPIYCISPCMYSEFSQCVCCTGCYSTTKQKRWFR